MIGNHRPERVTSHSMVLTIRTGNEEELHNYLRLISTGSIPSVVYPPISNHATSDIAMPSTPATVYNHRVGNCHSKG